MVTVKLFGTLRIDSGVKELRLEEKRRPEHGFTACAPEQEEKMNNE